MVWAFTGRMYSTYPFPSETLRLLSLEHFPKGPTWKKTHPIPYSRSQLCSPNLLPQSHLCSDQKKRWLKGSFYNGVQNQAMAALAQLEFRRLPLNDSIKKGVRYHVKYMHLPLCSKGHTVFSLVDCWEVKNGEG